MINVLLVDDHQLVRAGIRRLLSEARDIKVIGEAGTGEEAIQLVRQHKPDVVLMDIHMPGIGGLEATRRLVQHSRDIKVVGVTAHSEEPFPTRMLQAGAVGYLTKACKAEEIIAAIHEVHRGGYYLGADVSQQLALNALQGETAQSPLDKLSQRELQVMLMVTKGHRIQDISEKLFLSPKTVRTYRYRLLDKLGVRNDVELMKLAVRHGVIDGRN